MHDIENAGLSETVFFRARRPAPVFDAADGEIMEGGLEAFHGEVEDSHSSFSTKRGSTTRG